MATPLPPPFDSVRDEVRSYLDETMAQLRAPVPHTTDADGDGLAEQIFALLTSREFCYLSRTKTAPYRDEAVRLLRRRMGLAEPFRFFYDIGPGYHASLRPGEYDLRFHLGLSELLILAQIAKLCRSIAALYEHGARFWLVVDNLCGLRTNDIPLEQTEGYCADLRTLIREVGLQDQVDMIVESETFSLDEYDRRLSELPPQQLAEPPTPQAIANVARFLGRACTAAEAGERIERYRRTTAVTDRLVDELVRDVHMTQRATGATLGFRPFPGGDARTQVGEVMLARSRKGRLRPILVTDQNVDLYSLTTFTFPDVLPSTIPSVFFAEPDQAKYE
jgi:hypothetical protein